MYYEQQGIEGLAENRILSPTKQPGIDGMLRPKLYKYICETLRLTERGFAHKLSVSPAAVTQWLYTERMPRASVLARMMSAFDLTWEQLEQLFAT